MNLGKSLNLSELHFLYPQSEKANSKRAFLYVLECVVIKTGCTHGTVHPGCAERMDVEPGWTGRESRQGETVSLLLAHLCCVRFASGNMHSFCNYNKEAPESGKVK